MATSMDSDVCVDSDVSEDVLKLDGRDVRALTEYLFVERIADGLFRVYSEDGSFQLTEPDLGACECEDMQYRDPDGGCKHIRRVQYWTGREPLPEGVDRDAMDEHLVTAAEGQS